jgi:hypothetical protein
MNMRSLMDFSRCGQEHGLDFWPMQSCGNGGRDGRNAFSPLFVALGGGALSVGCERVGQPALRPLLTFIGGAIFRTAGTKHGRCSSSTCRMAGFW